MNIIEAKCLPVPHPEKMRVCKASEGGTELQQTAAQNHQRATDVAVALISKGITFPIGCSGSLMKIQWTGEPEPSAII